MTELMLNVKICKGCGVIFKRGKWDRGRRWEVRQYHTRKCYLSNKSNWNAGKTKADDSRIAQPWLGKTRPDMEGENNKAWKGDKAGKVALHIWAKRKFKDIVICQMCNKKTDKRLELANKNHMYKRDINDWMKICSACHALYDKKEGLRFA